MQANKKRPKKRQCDIDRIKKASRLEGAIKEIKETLPQKKKKCQMPLVTIQSWGQQQSVKAVKAKVLKAPVEKSHLVVKSGGVTRVRGELFPVTETCTAATMNMVTARSPAMSNHKVI